MPDQLVVQDQTVLQIVGIGTSAGGVKALQDFFEALPPHVGAAFVVIMHLDPSARSEMVAILATRTQMPVSQVDEPVRLESNHIYVIAPNTQLRLEDGVISTFPFEEPRGQRAPIDFFFRSLASQHKNVFAVILTGAGADGALGVAQIKEAGGIVLVQDPQEAEYNSMPRSAIATEVADFVLPIRELAARLVELVQQRGYAKAAIFDQSEQLDVGHILSYVQERTGQDFSQYKRATVVRRIARRIHLSQQSSTADYLKFLRDTPNEVEALFGDLLISVTSFFRDPESFGSLAQHVIPQLFSGKSVGDTIRVWVPGCATGEEAYSIGILLLEEAERRTPRPGIQVFGSDLDGGALAFARQGRFTAPIANEFDEARLNRYFWREGDHYRVRQELRDIVLFAKHSLIKDPPFSRIDLVSCRNLLIYLDRELQQRVLTTFHYALNLHGFLFLGSSENADQPVDLFRSIDRDARIFQATPGNSRQLVLPPLNLSRSTDEGAPPLSRASFSTHGIGDAAVHRQMLERIAPPSILVDASHRAIHLSESAGRFLEPSGGSLTTDVVDLVREEFRFDLRLALHHAFEQHNSTLSVATLLKLEGQTRRVYVQVKPVVREGHANPLALIMFIEGEVVEHLPESAGKELQNDAMQKLQFELQLTQTRLRTMREDSDAANEELRAANEELQSINEEYRSTSEELETSKEELQSINEELQTVNGELKLKFESVSRAHSDLENLMAATDFGILFLDPMMRIKRFTPRLVDLFNVTQSDEGRPITDFTHGLDFDDMVEQAQKVLRDLIPIQREVRGRTDGWYLARMRPYRTIEDKIDGVVVTFVDISERHRAEDALRDSEARLRQEMRLVELSRSPIFVWDFDGEIIQWNRGSEELYGYSKDEAVGQRKEILLRSIVPDSSFTDLRKSLLADGHWAGEIEHHTKDGRTVTVESYIELVTYDGKRLVLESTRDITERKRWQERQKLLLDELSHRVRNTLTVVQSMARQTLRNTASSTEFVHSFEGRLRALAAAHKLLVDTDWQGAALSGLIEEQLQIHMVAGSNRIRFSGDSVVLPAELATPFGLILHELATNAVKHGSLSAEAGIVSLTWHTAMVEDTTLLYFTWKESGGPLVETPTRKGFGSVLIEKGLRRAKVKRHFLPEGFLCTIELPL